MAEAMSGKNLKKVLAVLFLVFNLSLMSLYLFTLPTGFGEGRIRPGILLRRYNYLTGVAGTWRMFAYPAYWQDLAIEAKFDDEQNRENTFVLPQVHDEKPFLRPSAWRVRAWEEQAVYAGDPEVKRGLFRYAVSEIRLKTGIEPRHLALYLHRFTPMQAIDSTELIKTVDAGQDLPK